MIKIKLTITIIIILTFSISFSQEVEQDTLSEIILESSYSKKANSILPVTNISEKDINNYSPVDLIQVMNQTPGVYILSGALNTNRITIRGVGSRTPFGTNKIRAYFNEIPITNGTGETALEIYDPEMLQSIAIVKGPKATAFGTNLGGAILLKPAISNSTYLKNSFTVGSFNLIKNTLNGGYNSEKISLNFNYNHLSTDGYRQNSNYNRNAIFLNLGYSFNKRNKLDVLVNKNNFKAFIPSSINKTAFDENPKQASQNWLDAQGYEDTDYTLLGLTYSHWFNINFKNATTLFYSYNDHYEPAPFAIMDDFTNSYGIRSVFSGNINLFNTNLDVSVGGEMFRDDYNWDTYQNLYRDTNGNGSRKGNLTGENEEERNHLNVFTTAAFNLFPKLKAQLGLNLNLTSYDYKDQFNTLELNKDAHKNFDPIMAPSLSVTYYINELSSIYTNISKGYSFPSLEETLNPEGTINPNIKPETGINYELGTQLFFLNNNLHFSFETYIMSIKNLLVAERVTEDQYIGRNAGKTSHKGIEILLDYTWDVSSIKLAPFFNASFNFHKFEDFIDAENDYSGNNLTGVPDKNVNAGLRIEHKNGLFLIGTLQHVGEIPMTDANSLYSDSYTLLNVKAGYKTNFSDQLNFEINAGINNITDKKYPSSVLVNAVGFGGAEPRYYYPGNPVNYFSSLKIKYLF